MAAVEHLYWVTIIATHRKARSLKRHVSVPVRDYSWVSAAVCSAVLQAEERLVPSDELDDWWLEVRVYLANQDGASEGLCVGRLDGGVER